MVLGGYYKINYISILPAGILAQKYGAKKVAGYSQFISSCMSSIIPILAGYGPVVVTWIRAAQGALSVNLLISYFSCFMLLFIIIYWYFLVHDSARCNVYYNCKLESSPRKRNVCSQCYRYNISFI